MEAVVQGSGVQGLGLRGLGFRVKHPHPLVVAGNIHRRTCRKAFSYLCSGDFLNEAFAVAVGLGLLKGQCTRSYILYSSPWLSHPAPSPKHSEVQSCSPERPPSGRGVNFKHVHVCLNPKSQNLNLSSRQNLCHPNCILTCSFVSCVPKDHSRASLPKLQALHKKACCGLVSLKHPLFFCELGFLMIHIGFRVQGKT